MRSRKGSRRTRCARREAIGSGERKARTAPALAAALSLRVDEAGRDEGKDEPVLVAFALVRATAENACRAWPHGGFDFPARRVAAAHTEVFTSPHGGFLFPMRYLTQSHRDTEDFGVRGPDSKNTDRPLRSLWQKSPISCLSCPLWLKILNRAEHEERVEKCKVLHGQNFVALCEIDRSPKM